MLDMYKINTFYIMELRATKDKSARLQVLSFFFLLALQPPLGVVFYSPLVGFSLLAYEVS